MTSPTHDSFTIERIYPNCREHVWSAWSTAAKKAKWFGGETHSMDFRVGGRESAAFNDKMGEHVNETRYFEIVENERIVMAYSMAMNGRVHTVSLATVQFADRDGGTRLIFTEQMCVIPPSDGVEGRRHGWGELLGGLESFLVSDRRETSA
ncbi:SRPBCC family protein [Mesorhizobium sp. VNQ89]|uniref:SRPBCC family protein n=1 Tax=Mesorhizobium quangtriensis TaxID=3157709 RepID=UPI0032B6FA29